MSNCLSRHNPHTPDCAGNEAVSGENLGQKNVKAEAGAVFLGVGTPGVPVAKMHGSAQALHGSG
jgi:hypothetical protein